MSYASVDISYSAQFGTNGTGNDQFEYPAGMCVADSKLFIVDKQNNRVKIHDLAGVYIGKFGTVGSGNNNFFFPEDITTDGVQLYITDSANHRVKIHDLAGVYVGEFGTSGTGNTQFQYPHGITYDGVNLFIVDRQNNRIKEHTTAGAYVSKFGAYGITATRFNLPQGICFYDVDKLAIVDSGNKRVSLYRTNGTYIQKFGSFQNPSNVSDTLGVLSVVDKQDNRVFFYDYSGAEITNVSSALYFPDSSVYDNGKLYVTDSANHRVRIYDFTTAFASELYFQGILNLTKQLYPTGRAWWMKKGGTFDLFHEGLAVSESQAYAASVGILDSILPDNDNFSSVDADNWEQALSIYKSSGVSLTDRKAAILRSIAYPGNVLGRQHVDYIENELRTAGFDVYVHENRFASGGGWVTVDPRAAIYGEVKYSEVKYGSVGISGFTKIANYIDEAKDVSFDFGLAVNQRATFFIGGAVFPNFANVDINRKNEFRELILKLKPAQMGGYLLINYV